MATINAIAHLNELTKDVTNDYYVTAQVTETLDVKGVIERLRKREIATKNVDGEAFVNSFLDECSAASAEGNNIVTPFFRSSIGIQGVVYDNELGHNIPAERLKVSVNLTQGTGAKKAVEDAVVHVFEQSGATGPVPQSVTDPTVGTPDVLMPLCMVLIKGMRLALKGDNAAVGILFTKLSDEVGNPVPTDTKVLIPASKVYPNMPSQLQFNLPAEVTKGKWMVTVTTQSHGNGSTLMKEPRSGQYSNIVTVDPDDERPGEL